MKKKETSAADLKGDFNQDKRLLYLSLMAVFTGAICGVIAKVLILLIAFFTNLFFYQKISVAPSTPAGSHLGIFLIFVPVVGGLIIGLMARYGSERIRGHGIPEALEAILFGQSRMSPKIAILKPLSSAISIGSGGPFGAEGPIIMTGGAFGSIIGQFFHMTSAERKTILVAGAAAGMSATFASPVAAVLLAVELLLFEWRPRSLIPVALASATAAIVRVPLFGAGPLFPVPAHAAIANGELIYAVIAGILAGGLSALLSGLVYAFEDMFLKIPIHWMWWPAMGGLVVGIGGYFQPRALGVGYDIISDLLNGHLGGTGTAALGAVAALVAVKCVIWAFALGSGTSGGVLAPLLIIGGGLGVLESHFFSSATPLLWPLVSMAAVLGGMMRSPFTGTIFAFELTHDVEALLPLLIASVLGHAFTVLVMKRSILTEKVARRGYHVFREYTVDVLERVSAEEIMTTVIDTISGDQSVEETAAKFFGADQKHLGYPVVSPGGALIGMLSRHDILAVAPTQRNFKKIHEICEKKIRPVLPSESCRRIADIMAENNTARVPVVDPDRSNKLIGLVTFNDLLKPYAIQSKEENLRERFFKTSFSADSSATRPGY